MLVYDMVEDTNGISWPTAQWGMCPVRHPQGTSIKGSSGCVGGIWLFDIISDMASSQEFVEGRMNCHMGMYQNQSCYIWGDDSYPYVNIFYLSVLWMNHPKSFILYISLTVVDQCHRCLVLKILPSTRPGKHTNSYGKSHHFIAG